MRKKVFFDEIDIFDKVIERYNPKHEKLTQEIYMACQDKFLNDEEYDCRDFHKYMFFSVCDGLRKYYVDKDLDPQTFEDDVSSAYLMVLRHVPDQRFKTAQEKYQFVLRDVVRKLEKEKFQEKCSNAYLNGECNPNVDKFESSEKEEVLTKERRAAILKEIQTLGISEQKVILQYFGIYGEEKNFRQLAEENSKNVEEIKSKFEQGMKSLRSPSCANNLKEFVK